eukprot:NODE_31_length_32452_cov_0.352672.p14 type:complete len:245 gc:universal NODE_31_length_32452_cov_0.352672:26009-26743(+)
MELLFDTKSFNYDDLVLKDDLTTENSVCAINYSEDFRQLHLAWIQLHEEESERVFHLSTLLIQRNPSHYTVYIDRIKMVKVLKKSLTNELQFINEIIMSNQKNYQVWNYRQSIVMLLLEDLEAEVGRNAVIPTEHIEFQSKAQLIESELDFVHDGLEIEPKNYHAFTYLYHLLPWFNEKILSNELLFTLEQINVDVYNNSIWHYRMQLLKKSKDWKESEIELVLASLEKSKENESVWAHIAGYQ